MAPGGGKPRRHRIRQATKKTGAWEGQLDAAPRDSASWRVASLPGSTTSFESVAPSTVWDTGLSESRFALKKRPRLQMCDSSDLKPRIAFPLAHAPPSITVS